MTDFTYAVDGDGVATITWDVSGKSMNVMSMAGFAELDGLIDRALADAAVKLPRGMEPLSVMREPRNREHYRTLQAVQVWT